MNTLRNEFSHLVSMYGNEAREQKVIVQQGFHGKALYKGKVIDIHKEHGHLLERQVIAISNKNGKPVYCIN